MGMTCQYCAMHHSGVCPRIKAIEYRPDGSIGRVEFHGPRPIEHSIATAEPIIVQTPLDHGEYLAAFAKARSK